MGREKNNVLAGGVLNHGGKFNVDWVAKGKLGPAGINDILRNDRRDTPCS